LIGKQYVLLKRHVRHKKAVAAVRDSLTKGIPSQPAGKYSAFHFDDVIEYGTAVHCLLVRVSCPSNPAQFTIFF
jgi:hypothetical protein